MGEDCSKNFLVVSFPPSDNIRSCSSQGLWKRKKNKPSPRRGLPRASSGKEQGERRGRGTESTQHSTRLCSPATRADFRHGLLAACLEGMLSLGQRCLAACRDVRKAQQLLTQPQAGLFQAFIFIQGHRFPHLPHPASNQFPAKPRCMQQQSASCRQPVHASASRC